MGRDTGCDVDEATAVRHARSFLEAPAQADEARRDHAEKLARDGRRTVESVCADPFWELRDWLTGEVLASGVDGAAGCRAAARRLDPAGGWYAADDLYTDVEVPAVTTPGLPPLAHALEEWLTAAETPDEEIAAFVGWPVERVRQNR